MATQLTATQPEVGAAFTAVALVLEAPATVEEALLCAVDATAEEDS